MAVMPMLKICVEFFFSFEVDLYVEQEIRLGSRMDA